MHEGQISSCICSISWEIVYFNENSSASKKNKLNLGSTIRLTLVRVCSVAFKIRVSGKMLCKVKSKVIPLTGSRGP
jgi:hypothetical protein